MSNGKKPDTSHLKEFLPYLQLLNKESERGKVLISTGFLEEQLKNIVLAFMLDNGTAQELVDGGNAPLGTLSARIAACYSLALISDVEHHDLTLIRKIRNDFAHNIHTNFETPRVIERCKALKLKAPDYTHSEMGEVVVGSAGQFTTSAVCLILNLLNRPHYVRENRRAFVPFPY